MSNPSDFFKSSQQDCTGLLKTGGFVKQIYSLCLLLVLGACVKISDKNAEEAASSPVAMPSPKAQEVPQDSPLSQAQQPSARPQVLAMPEAHKYQVWLPMPSEAQIVQRSIKSIEGQPVPLPMKVSDGVFRDENPESGKVYIYDVGVVHEGDFETLATYEVRIPEDRVFDAEYVLTKNEPIRVDGRLFLTRNGVITTNGFSLLIEAHHLISTQGLIRTFPEGYQAGPGQTARAGGQIQLSVRTASGELKIEMRGERGAVGAKGSDLPQNAPNGGSPGAPGGCGGCGFYLRRQGNPGGAGGSGFPGGNSGTFEVEIFEAHQLTLVSEIKAGAGGAGGVGGLGEPDTSFVIQGPLGPTGASGADGSREFSYFKDLKGRRTL